LGRASPCPGLPIDLFLTVHWWIEVWLFKEWKAARLLELTAYPRKFTKYSPVRWRVLQWWLIIRLVWSFILNCQVHSHNLKWVVIFFKSKGIIHTKNWKK
jgi:hypothetical protein